MIDVSLTTRLLITLCFMALLTIASVIPGRAEPGDSVFIWMVAKTPTAIQKTLHICLYGLLTFLCAWTLDAIQSKPLRFAMALTIAVSFGALMEWYQTRIPGRFGTLLDVAINAAGAILGLIAAAFIL